MKAAARAPHALVPLLALLGTTACGDSTDPGGQRLDIEAGEVLLAIQSLVVPVRTSADAGSTLLGATDALVDAGVEFDREPPQPEKGEWLGFDFLPELASVVFPPEVQGQTFIYDPAREQWVIDESRTDAPETGIRVVWYALSNGFLVFPLNERGYIDLTDEDDGGALSLLGVRMVADNATETLLLSEFTRGHALTVDGTEEVERVEAAGFYSDGANDADFDLASVASADEATGGYLSSLDLELTSPGTGPSYAVHFEESAASSADDPRGRFLITVVRDGVTTVLDIDLPGEGDTDGSGTLSHAGTTIANVTLNSGQSRFTTPDGQRVDSGQAVELSALVRAMLIGWLDVVSSLPIFFD
ncbi:MAG: hypothetical protein GWN71_22430 [Gammaproteobacteria bacterium]|nr:hypothetical protein [Gemmatimonadota bacterium]NIR38250.1 hypothetical protein [Actinomycetota bacterium]NIU76217.1 hypothetical protein [Gammaproteobacteria bacterium]NIX22063.1 hypothetical protein [Actinomycetota bacterium]